MKKQILFLSIFILLIAGSSLVLTKTQIAGSGSFALEAKNTHGKHGLNKAQIAEEAIKWRFDLLKDENGNFYPSYFGNAMVRADALKQMGTRSGLGLQWEELGPDNVGGRTRAILIDKRDPSNQTLYAGGVSGGMWKSKDGGNTWNKLANWNQWLAIASIAQGPDNAIYIGTGEGFSDISEGTGASGTSMNSGTMGNGIFTLDANDNPILLTPNLFTNNDLSPGSPWTAVNRIAVNPVNAKQIIAATYSGIYESQDEGVTWKRDTMTGAIHTLVAAEADDIKWSHDGSRIYASVGGLFSGNVIESLDNGMSWEGITSGTNPGFPGGSLGRIEIALAPSNDSILYISIATTRGCTDAVYRSGNAGATWTDIGNKGPLFDPMSPECQGWYDNTIAVNPANPNKIYNAGVDFYTWSDVTGWTLAEANLPNTSLVEISPNYIHADKHTIVFAANDSNTMYVGCDGGIYKSTDAGSYFPFPHYQVINRGYNVTQNYSIAAAITGEVMGGSQDNGTNYINYLGNTPMSAQQVIGGDGIFTAISHINPQFYFGGVYYAQVYRSGQGGTGPYSAFFDIKVDPQGYGTTTICDRTCTGGDALACGPFDAPFITPFLLGETKTAADGLKQVPFIAAMNYNAGDTITAASAIANYPFQTVLTRAVNAGDTISVNDPVRSRFFLTSNCGVFMTSDALNLSIIPRWFELNNSISGLAESYANTGDGNVLYIGTSSGLVYRFNNLNARCDTTSYPPGDTIKALYSNSVDNSKSIVANGRPIEGIAVDPNNSNHVVAAVAGFSSSNQPHVYESVNGGSTWKADTAGLPNIPVYSVVIHDSTTFIIGTELGIWTWSGSQWTEDNGGGMERAPVYRMIETNLYTDGCPVIYIGVHGRGMWRCTSLTPSGCSTGVPTGVAGVKNISVSGLNIFPNPVQNSLHVSLTLGAKADVVLRVFDMTGKMYTQTTYTNTVNGENLFALDASGLGSGTYLLAATVAGARTESRLFVVAK